MRSAILGLCAAILLSGCLQAPDTPEKLAANRAGMMRVVSDECMIYLGGLSGVREVMVAADEQEAEARSLGADDTIIAQGQQTAENAFGMISGLTDRANACSDFVGRTAELTM